MNDIKQRLVESGPVPELVNIEGIGECYFIPLTAGQVIELHGGMTGKGGADRERRFGAELVQRTLCDEQGNLQLGPDDLALVLKQPLRLFKAMTEATMRISGFSQDSQDDLASK